jgi:hypothetical protein
MILPIGAGCQNNRGKPEQNNGREKPFYQSDSPGK